MSVVLPSQLENKSKVSYKFYPTLRSDYTETVGKLTEMGTSKIIMDRGYDVEPHLVQDEGADVVIPSLKGAIEILNWKESHYYDKRIESIVENLRKFDCKGLLVSFINEEARMKIKSKIPDIVIKELGFQILPNKYYEFYNNRNQTDNRRFWSKRTEKHLGNVIDSIIQDFLKIEESKNTPLYPEIQLIPIPDIDNKEELTKCIQEFNTLKDKKGLRYVYDISNGHLSYPLLYNIIKTEQNQSPTEVKTVPKSLLFSPKTPNNEEQSEHSRLDCSNCLRKNRCDILNNLEYVKLMRPHKKYTQFNLTDNFSNISKIDEEALKNRRRTWLKQLGEAQCRQLKCLNKRMFLYRNKNYRLFDVQ